MRILLIEDEEELGSLLVKSLAKAGFSVDFVGSAGEAEHASAIVAYDVVLLDLGLPDRDGRDRNRGLRGARPDIPILVITARDSLEDRIKGLNIGADDYLTKPFDPRELNARVRALLRRPGGLLGATLVAGNVSLDTVTRNLSVEGQPIAATRREIAVLELLLRTVGRVVPREIMEDKIYGIDDELMSNPVPVHIHRLRSRLAEAGATTEIHTVRGIGYLLTDKT